RYNLNAESFSINIPGIATPFCYECKYTVEFSVVNEQTGVEILNKSFNNLQTNLSETVCRTNSSAPFTGTGVNNNIITFTADDLAPGSYIVRKTLKIDEASLATYKQSYLSNAIKKSEQTFIDEALIELKASSNCEASTGEQVFDCAACEAALGNFATYKAQYLANIGKVEADYLSDADLKKEIDLGFAKREQQCKEICGTVSTDALNIREMMLADMVPLTGQYALGVAPAATCSTNLTPSMFNSYDIFYETSSIKAKFKQPLLNATTAGQYYDEYGNIDNFFRNSAGTAIDYDNGKFEANSPLYKQQYITNFKTEWAVSLLPHHPEYAKLLFYESMTSSNLWFEKLKNTDTYAAAVTNGFLKADGTGKINVMDNGTIKYLLSDIDPFFTTATGHLSTMQNYLRVDHPDLKYNSTGTQRFNFWHFANFLVRCRDGLAANQNACYSSSLINTSNKYPFDGLTDKQKDELWQTFKGLYVNARTVLLNTYLEQQRAVSNKDRLICQGYKLHFATNDQLASMYAGQLAMMRTGYTTANFQSDVNAKAAEQKVVSCEDYIIYWRDMFKDCDQINGKAPAVKEAILTAITNGFKSICEASDIIGGSSSLKNNASQNFESVVKSVFSSYGISFSELCHPYNVLTPEPYGMGRKLVRDMVIKVAKCECEKFESQYTQYLNSIGNSSPTINGFNDYLSGKKLDNISATLYASLLENCSKICRSNGGGTSLQKGTDEPVMEALAVGCETGRDTIVLSEAEVLPNFLKCGETPVCYDCTAFKNFHTAFKAEYAHRPLIASEVLFGNTENSIMVTDLFAKYVNFKTGFKLLASDYYNYLNNKCNITVGGSTTILCRTSKPLSDLPNLDPEDPCRDAKFRSILIGRERYEAYVRDLSEDFERLYRAKCTPPEGREQFSVTYTNKEYHYTLYYYDQAGNLVKTVPPKGVKPETSEPYLTRVKADRQNNAAKVGSGTTRNVPEHGFLTTYNYNTLNQVISQTTPDAGTSRFWYDQLGRLVVSRNAQQLAGNKYSYTLYDKLGRIIEVGEKTTTVAMTVATALAPVNLKAWIDNSARTQITRTYYNEAKVFLTDGPGSERFVQHYLRDRVSYSAVITSDNTALANINEFGAGTNHNNYQSATYYDYDLHGNVANLLHDYRVGVMNSLHSSFNRYKIVSYKYDLISGKVNEVNYQPEFTDASGVLRSFKDAYKHRYEYDAENKLTKAFTSKDGIYWERDAEYKYYQHGPLARTELGQMRVQGLDYIYTLQGWLKGVNSTVISESKDPGLDGNTVVSNNANKLVARDIFGFSLDYYVGDYKPINTSKQNVHIRFGDADASNPALNLYNGNIRAMSTHFGGVNFKPINGGPQTIAGNTTTYLYSYDQLNRLKSTKTLANVTSDYHSLHYFTPEQFNYDPNGNITFTWRNGLRPDGTFPNMDYINYIYNPTNNRLNYVTDDPATTNLFPDDINDQSSYNEWIGSVLEYNYTYDQIGNLIKDKSEQITNISWNVYGKIASITKAGNTITYSYDAGGNRISKTTSEGTTWYVRDAQGNTLAVYFTKGTTLKHIENHMYGSSRLGVHNTNTTVDGYMALGASMPIPGKTGNYSGKTGNFTRGNKFFELSNHLGNVMMVISDRKLQVANGANTLVDYYKAEVMTATDYYAFGSPMPERTFKREGERGNANKVLHKTSFDNSLDGWVTYGGSSAVTLDNGRVKVWANTPWGTVMKVLNLKVGKTYKISFTIDMGTCTGITMPFYLAPGSTPAYQWSTNVTSLTTSGSYVTYFTPTVSYYRWLFETVSYTGPEGYFWLDNILVEEVEDGGDGDGSLESNG
ncbi:RHS repeat domain-containing protein, partial [Polluticaenibacter yanchengensis]|nr:hypothetical protein [Chitinophagaceae bacterium LY-5]